MENEKSSFKDSTKKKGNPPVAANIASSTETSPQQPSQDFGYVINLMRQIDEALKERPSKQDGKVDVSQDQPMNEHLEPAWKEKERQMMAEESK